MSTLKRLVIFYFINLIVLYILGKITVGEYFNLNVYGYLVIPFVFVLLGQLIGFFAFVLVDKQEAKARVFLKSAIISSTVLGLIYICVSFFHWKHNRDFGNIEANEDHFKYYNGEYKNEEKIAFDSLTKKFVNPNTFKLTGSSIHGTDTIINGNKGTIFFLSLRYIKKDPGVKYKANFILFNNKASLIFFDKLLDSADELRIDSLWRKGKQDINDAMKVIPDSIRKEIKENFKEILDN